MKAALSGCMLWLLLALTPLDEVRAQALQTQDWAQWNAISEPVYPGENWMRYETPEEAGWSTEKLAALRQMSDRARTAAVMVIYNGAILTQWGETGRRFYIHSVGKSILSALYGQAVEAGEIDLGKTLGEIGIDDITPLTDVEKTAKVSDLLKARSGIYLPAAGESADMRRQRPARGSHAPGTHWSYNGWDFDALATIYNQETGGDLFAAFEHHLSIPLQMQDYERRHSFYYREPGVSRHAWYPMRMSARDLARFGLLYLNQGRWRDAQILPPDWVRDSAEAHSTNSMGGYGYLWWTFPEKGRLGKLGAYAAFGYGAQAVYVVPGANLVLVHRANTYDDRQHVMSSAIENILLGVLQARTGPPSRAPRLAPAVLAPPEDPRHELSDRQVSALTGQYAWQDSDPSTVSETGGRLTISHPHTGTFYLFPRGVNEFEIEDEKRRALFTLEANGEAIALTIWIRPDLVFEGRRVAGNQASN